MELLAEAALRRDVDGTYARLSLLPMTTAAGAAVVNRSLIVAFNPSCSQRHVARIGLGSLPAVI
jgi:hypothetical protein